MTKYPALYARSNRTPSTGGAGQRARFATGTAVVWHLRTGDHAGERTTERNTVQALRDEKTRDRRRPRCRRLTRFGHPREQNSSAAKNTRQRSIQRPSFRVSWGNSVADVPDLNAAITATFGRMEQKA